MTTTDEPTAPSEEAKDPETRASPGALRLLVAFVGLALASLPFLAVTFPPAADLPQHVAQIRLLEELLGLAPRVSDVDAMRVLWGSPNILCYLPLFVTVKLFGPVAGGRIGLGLLCLAEVAALHAIAARRGRPAFGALLAGTVVFNASLYWGFLNFVSAVPFFLLLLDRVSRPAPTDARTRDALATAGLAFLVYLGHSLLFALAGLFVLLFGLARREPVRALAPRLLAFAPAALAALAWFPELAALRRDAGFDVAAHWFTSPLSRLGAGAFRDAALGGLHGVAEPFVLVALAVYVLASVVTHRRAFLEGSDRPLLAASAALFAVYLFGPDKWMNTIVFAQRFAPIATFLLVLAVPSPRLRASVVGAYAVVVATVFAFVTTMGWVLFDVDELSGLSPSLAAIHGPTRLLGLDFRRESGLVKGQPFLQLFAYGQAMHGGEVGFSFAEHMSSIVAYREPRRVRWTPGLEWFPGRVSQRDLAHFDYVLVVGEDSHHERFAAFSSATPLVREGHVRLYRLPARAPSSVPASAPAAP